MQMWRSRRRHQNLRSEGSEEQRREAAGEEVWMRRCYECKESYQTKDRKTDRIDREL